MNDMMIRSGDLLPPSMNTARPAGETLTEGKNFSSTLRNAIEDINKLQVSADEAIAQVQLDNTSSLHEAIVALEKADISFRAMIQVRNKILDAYQEVMRTQV